MQDFQLQTKNFNKTPKCWLLISAGYKYICSPAKFHLQPCQTYVWPAKWVIIGNNSFITQNLKAVGPLGGKFDFFSPSGFEIQSDFDYRTSKNQVLLCQNFEMLSEWEKSDTWSSNSNDLKI